MAGSEALMTGLMAEYASANGATLRGKVNGLWPYRAKPGATAPYLTWELIDGSPDWSMGGGLIEKYTVQLDVWDSGRSPLVTVQAADALMDLFDHSHFSVTGYTFVRAERVFAQLLQEPDEGWHFAVRYEYEVQKD